jgi:hypothetical protein
VPEIGQELAAARALPALAHMLLDTAAGDIEDVTHAPVSLADSHSACCSLAERVHRPGLSPLKEPA